MKLLAMLFVALLFGCENPQAATTARAPTALDWATADASLRLEVTAADQGLAMLRDTFAPLSETHTTRAWEQAFRIGLGFEPFKPDGWIAWGVSVKAPAMIFVADGLGAAVVDMPKSEPFEKWVDRATVRGEISSSREELGDYVVHRLSTPSKEGGDTLMHVAVGRGEAVLVPSGLLGPHHTDTEVVAALRRWREPQRARFLSDRHNRAANERATGGLARGVVRPGEWLKRLPARGHSATLLQKLVRQTGPTGIVIAHDVPRRWVDLHVHMKADPEEPAFVRSLKGARGELPEVGGLVEPGVLAVVRLSVEPNKFYRLVRSNLPADQRRKLDTWLGRLRDEMKIDVERDVLQNLKGHAVIAVYGVEPDALDRADGSLLGDLFALRATREAILLPISDRTALVRILDVAAQLSNGRLNGQRLGGSIHYAWIDDSGLNWAFIVSDTHVIFVDSSVAFDRALRFGRQGNALDDALVKRGVGELLKGRDTSGLYVDSEGARNLLRDSPQSTLAEWFELIDAIVMTSEPVKGDADVTHFRLVLRKGVPAGEDAAGPGSVFKPVD